MYRDLPHPEADDNAILIMYGWCGECVPRQDQRCVVSGIHLGAKVEEHIHWLRLLQQPIGARDSYTQGFLKSNRIDSTLIGCATLTLNRYNGPRTGRLAIDVMEQPGAVALSNRIVNLTWADQWQLAAQRLEQLRKASIVYTSRLHIVLPCLAFGTPVVFPLADYENIRGKERLTIFDSLGCDYDVPMQMDVSDWADRYHRFLSESLQMPLRPSDSAAMPTPFGSYWLQHVNLSGL